MAFFAERIANPHKKNESRFNPVSELLWRFSNSVVKPEFVGTKVEIFSHKQKIYRIFFNKSSFFYPLLAYITENKLLAKLFSNKKTLIRRSGLLQTD